MRLDLRKISSISIDWLTVLCVTFIAFTPRQADPESPHDVNDGSSLTVSYIPGNLEAAGKVSVAFDVNLSVPCVRPKFPEKK